MLTACHRRETCVAYDPAGEILLWGMNQMDADGVCPHCQEVERNPRLKMKWQVFQSGLALDLPEDDARRLAEICLENLESFLAYREAQLAEAAMWEEDYASSSPAGRPVTVPD